MKNGNSPTASRLRFDYRPSDLNLAGLPKEIDDQHDHLCLNRMFISNEGHHQIIGERIDEQKTCEEKRAALSIANRQPKSCEGKYRSQQEISVTGNHQIVTGEYRGLRRSHPKIDGTLDGKPQKASRMFQDELPNFVPFFGHET